MFTFFIHPRNNLDGIDYHDVERIKRAYGILPFNLWIPIGCFTRLLCCLPHWVNDKVLPLLPPITTGRIYSSKKTAGWIVTIPMTAKQILERAEGSPKQKAVLEKKLVKAVRLSKRMGARIVGLGAMTAPATVGGKTLVGKVEGVGITNGNALTAVITVQGVKAIARRADIDLNASKIAIIGATGSVGKAASLLLSKSLGKCELLLISRSPGKLNQLKRMIEKENQEVEVTVSDKVNAIKDCDVVVVTTSDSGVIVKKEHLRKGMIIYDDTQPRNVSEEIARDTDFLVVDGGIVRIPEVHNTMDIGLPTDSDMYACEAETYLLSIKERFGDFALGRDVIKQAKEMQVIADEYGLCLAPFKSFGNPLIDEDFKRIRTIRRQENRG